MAKQGETQARVFEFLCRYMRENGYPPSVREIGRAVGLSSSETVQRHLEALEEQGKIRRQHSARGRAIEILEGDDPLLTPGASAAVPLVGRVAAGAPLLASEHVEGVYPFPREFIGEEPAFMLRVRGDSMIEAGIFDGDFVIVRKQETARDGEIVVALVEGGEATVKFLYRERDHVRLEPANHTMGPILCRDVQILGRVTWVVRQV